MTQMVGAVEEVSRSASEAMSAANEANENASQGSQVVDATISTVEALAEDIQTTSQIVEKLSEDSQNIGSVIDVIHGIADQTNLLALNATIEAARAGALGRGFAVVADEVRDLAHRTQTATQEIRGMIESIQADVNNAVEAMRKSHAQSYDGVQQVSQVKGALDVISGSIDQISNMNQQIASAVEEESTVAAEINSNISDISERSIQTNQNAQHTKETGESLAVLANQLQGSVVQFKI